MKPHHHNTHIPQWVVENVMEQNQLRYFFFLLPNLFHRKRQNWLSRIKYFYPSDAFWPPLRQIHLPHLPSIQTIIIGRCLRFGRAFSLFVLLKLRFPSIFFGWMEQLMIIFVYLLLAEFCFFYFFSQFRNKTHSTKPTRLKAKNSSPNIQYSVANWITIVQQRNAKLVFLTNLNIYNVHQKSIQSNHPSGTFCSDDFLLSVLCLAVDTNSPPSYPPLRKQHHEERHHCQCFHQFPDRSRSAASLSSFCQTNQTGKRTFFSDVTILQSVRSRDGRFETGYS